MSVPMNVHVLQRFNGMFLGTTEAGPVVLAVGDGLWTGPGLQCALCDFAFAAAPGVMQQLRHSLEHVDLTGNPGKASGWAEIPPQDGVPKRVLVVPVMSLQPAAAPVPPLLQRQRQCLRGSHPLRSPECR